MPGQGREIRRRIKSIKSTRQVTRAMELVSAAKMRKSVMHVLMTRPYAQSSWGTLRTIAARTRARHHPLLEERKEVKRIGLILVTSNRGLAGSFNTNVIALARRYVLHHRENVNMETDLVLMGKKGRDVVRKHGHTVIAEFVKVDVTTRVEEVRPLAKLAIEEYLKGTYDRIMLCYTDFVSSLVQKPRLRQILPLVGEDPYLGSVHTPENDSLLEGEEDRVTLSPAMQEDEENGYLFEPSPERVLELLIPRLVEMQIYQAILESDASEHSARMLAMRNASDAAGDMIDELSLVYNQSRQAGITQEIAEISAGRIAVER